VRAGQAPRAAARSNPAPEPDGFLVTHADLGQPGWNDIVADGRGNIYVNRAGFNPTVGEEFRPGFVFLVAPDGSVRQVADDIAFPNGMTVTRDNSTLIVADSYRHQLVGFDIGADGGMSGLASRAEVLLANAAYLSGDLAEQQRHGQRAIELARAAPGREGLAQQWHQCGDRMDACDGLELLGVLATARERPADAARLLAAAAAARPQLGYLTPGFAADRRAAARAADDVRRALGEEEFGRAWARGQALTLDAAVALAARHGGGRKRPAAGWASLTPAELEVVRLVGRGLRNEAIARQLFIAPSTVKVHLSHVFTKLGVTTRAELAAQAALRGEHASP